MAAHRDIEARVFRLALASIRWARSKNRLPPDREMVRQFVRAVTSVGAHLEEARGAQTKADFVHKVAVARKEAFEAHYWVRLLVVDDHDETPRRLAGELNEVASILTAIVRRSRASVERG